MHGQKNIKLNKLYFTVHLPTGLSNWYRTGNSCIGLRWIKCCVQLVIT